MVCAGRPGGIPAASKAPGSDAHQPRSAMHLPRAASSSLLLAAALATGCATGRKPGPAAAASGNAASGDAARLAVMLDRYWEDVLVLNPILATLVGDDRYDDQLPNLYAPEYRARQKAHVEK